MEARDFQAEFNASLPRSAAEHNTLRPMVTTKLTELANAYRQAQKEQRKIEDDIRDFQEGDTTPKAVMAQADLRHKYDKAEVKTKSAYERFLSACFAALDAYTKEVDTLYCPIGTGPF